MYNNIEQHKNCVCDVFSWAYISKYCSFSRYYCQHSPPLVLPTSIGHFSTSLFYDYNFISSCVVDNDAFIYEESTYLHVSNDNDVSILQS